MEDGELAFDHFGVGVEIASSHRFDSVNVDAVSHLSWEVPTISVLPFPAVHFDTINFMASNIVNSYSYAGREIKEVSEINMISFGRAWVS